MAVFSGGSLLVGAVGRTDLLGKENAEPYARAMFHSLHDKLLAQADYVGVLPTHGGGSLCSKDIATTPSSTIGYERRHNELLGIDEIEPFVPRCSPTSPRIRATSRACGRSTRPGRDHSARSRSRAR